MSVFMLVLWIAILLLVIADDISISAHKLDSKEDLHNRLTTAKIIEYMAIVVIILLELENILG